MDWNKEMLRSKASDDETAQSCINWLLHSVGCRTRSCPNGLCARMKQVMSHANRCRRSRDSCQTCARLYALCIYHARMCTATAAADCEVPHCLDARQRMAYIRHSEESLRRSDEPPPPLAPMAQFQPPSASVDENGESVSANAYSFDFTNQTADHCIALLVHASNCENDNCALPSCSTLNRFLVHARKCATIGCSSCTTVAALCYCHSINCKETVACPMPYCAVIRQKLQVRSGAVLPFRAPPPRPTETNSRLPSSSTTNGSGETAADRMEAIQRIIDLMAHAGQCRRSACRMANCARIKHVIGHLAVCRQRPNCVLCQQFIALCKFHAMRCVAASCSVPYCTHIREVCAEHMRQGKKRPLAIEDCNFGPPSSFLSALQIETVSGGNGMMMDISLPNGRQHC